MSQQQEVDRALQRPGFGHLVAARTARSTTATGDPTTDEFVARGASHGLPSLSLVQEPAPAPPVGVLPASSRENSFARVATRYLVRLIVLDLLVAVALFALLGWAVTTLFPDDPVNQLAPGGPGVAWPLLVALNGGYQRSRIGIGTGELRAVLKAGLWLPLLGAYPAAILDDHGWLLLMVTAAPVVTGAALVLRVTARHRLHRRQAGGVGSRRTLAVGPADAVAELLERLAREPHCGMRVEAACVPDARSGAAQKVTVPVLGDLHSVRRVAEAHGFEAVAVSGGECMNEAYLRRLLWSLEGLDVELLIAPGLAEVVRPRMDIRPLVGVPLLHVRQARFTGWQRRVKRALDLVLTVIGLVVISPLMVGAALAAKLEDGGPVVFRQTRIGRGGRPFEMLKFRSMVMDAEARKAALMSRNEGHDGLFKLTDDPRVTRVGRFLRQWSIDELPQLFNVLGGSMSLVGPRPHLAAELALMPADSSRRALVTPGLTGLWQISGRSDLGGGEGLRLDLRYVENWSIALDLHIIWKTFWAVLRRAGAR